MPPLSASSRLQPCCDRYAALAPASSFPEEPPQATTTRTSDERGTVNSLTARGERLASGFIAVGSWVLPLDSTQAVVKSYTMQWATQKPKLPRIFHIPRELAHLWARLISVAMKQDICGPSFCLPFFCLLREARLLAAVQVVPADDGWIVHTTTLFKPSDEKSCTEQSGHVANFDCRVDHRVFLSTAP